MTKRAYDHYVIVRLEKGYKDFRRRCSRPVYQGHYLNNIKNWRKILKAKGYCKSERRF